MIWVPQVKHLSFADSARLDASGAGQIEAGPSGEEWLILRTTVSTSGPPDPEPTVQLYRNSVSQAGLIEGTRSGNGDASDSKVFLGQGEKLIAVWAGGTAGAVAVVRLEGVAYAVGAGLAALAGGG